MFIEIKNRAELRACLKAHHVPFEAWGKSQTKSLEHLFAEIMDHESRLVEEEDGQLIRQLRRTDIDLYYPLADISVHHLEEESHHFEDGNVYEYHWETSISKKMRHDEIAEETAGRAFKEELQFERVCELVPMGTRNDLVLNTLRYPQLNTKCEKLLFSCMLPEELYNPHGYTVPHNDKTKVFVWRPIEKRLALTLPLKFVATVR